MCQAVRESAEIFEDMMMQEVQSFENTDVKDDWKTVQGEWPR